MSNPLHAAVVFLAVLAYPESFERRTRAAQAMRAWSVRVLMNKRRSDSMGAAARAILDAIPDQQILGQLGRLEARLMKRLDAARVASEIELGVHKTVGEEKIDPTEQQRNRFALMSRGISPCFATELTATTRTVAGPPMTLNEHARRRPSKWKNEAWRPEVLHLAMAFRELQLARTFDERAFSVPELLREAIWAPEAIKRSEEIAEEWLTSADLPESMRGVRQRPLIRLVPGNSDSFEISEPV